MSQIIIVSNRLPVSVKKSGDQLEFSASVGGLATGLASYVDDKSSIWIGWPGIASDELTAKDKDEITEELAKQNCLPVFLTKKQIDDFYNGYSNTVLWPLFHKMRPQDRPGKRRDGWYRSYRTVNRLFAEAVEAAVQDNTRVWVHDYQLLLVPEMLRKMDIGATIGFFLHIPFPEPKKFMTLPRHRIMMRGILGADLIGFHTPDYVKSFLDTADKCGLGLVGDGVLEYQKRLVQISDFPMGIDYEKFAQSGKSAEVKKIADSYNKRYRGKKIIVAVDRLDPSKGLSERLKTYEELLKRYPKLLKKVVFVMVAAPSRTEVPAYQRLAKRLRKQVDHINSTYGTTKWQPVEYIDHVVPFEKVTALFQAADVAFIAPLRDGMNLAAKEFIASTRKKSALILSETAGAAHELRDALIVNPRKPETVVKGLYKSLTMKPPELTKRLKNMKSYLRDNTVHTWAKDFVGTLDKSIPRSPTITRTLNKKLSNNLIAAYRNSQKRLIMLDYDGTLIPFVREFHEAEPTKALMNLLKKLCQDSANDVVLISGRNSKNLQEWFGHLPVSLVSEHGASIRYARRKTWKLQFEQNVAWKKELLPLCEKIASDTPGAKVEEKNHSLVWHYRGVKPYHAQKNAIVLRRILKPYLKKYDLVIMNGHKIIEIKNPHFTKGTAAQNWLKNEYDFILCAGDDITDEDLFKVSPSDAYSIKVGRGRTTARFRLQNHTAVLKLLGSLDKR